jgi:hypothetical protein
MRRWSNRSSKAVADAGASAAGTVLNDGVPAPEDGLELPVAVFAEECVVAPAQAASSDATVIWAAILCRHLATTRWYRRP